MKLITEYVKQASNFHFPHVVNEYLSTKVAKPSIIKATDDTIHEIVKDELDRLGHDADLNHIDVSKVTDMNNLFNLSLKYKDLNPDISQWDVSNVFYMQIMFYGCIKFNQDLSQWNVNNVHDMDLMFYYCKNFNQDLSQWDVSNVETAEYMFYKCENFNQDLSQWDVRNVKNYNRIFFGCPIKEEFKPKFNRYII